MYVKSHVQAGYIFFAGDFQVKEVMDIWKNGCGGLEWFSVSRILLSVSQLQVKWDLMLARVSS